MGVAVASRLAVHTSRDGASKVSIEGGGALLGSPVGLAGQPVSASLVLASPRCDEALLQAWRELVPTVGEGAVTLLPGLLVARWLGPACEPGREWCARLWAVASNGVSPLEYPGLLVNDLEPAATSLMPEIGEAKDRLADAGAPFVGMTGSGPTVFGLFPTEQEARQTAERVGESAMVCQGGKAP